MSALAKNKFNSVMIENVEEMKNKAGYNPTRFSQMMSEHGGAGAAVSCSKGKTRQMGSRNFGRTGY